MAIANEADKDDADFDRLCEKLGKDRFLQSANKAVAKWEQKRKAGKKNSQHEKRTKHLLLF